MKSSHAAFAVLVLGLSGCPADEAATELPTEVVTPPPPPPVEPAPLPDALLATFEGTLPCADCAGIATRLSLYTEDSPGQLATHYKLSQTYLATKDGDRTFESAGSWIVLRGSAADPDDTVYELDPEEPLKARAFLRVSDTELRALDRSYAEIPGTASHTLKAAAASPTPSGPVELGEADSGKAFTLKTGQTLVLRLESNRTTGYAWIIVADDEAILIPTEATYEETPKAPGVVGSGGVEVFKFSPSKAGAQTLTLNYARSFETDVPPAKTVTYAVTVE